MIQPVQPEYYPSLLDVQIESIRSLIGVYSQEEVEAWVGYLENATPERFAAFENRAWLNDQGTVDAFVSWREDTASGSAALECLYVREQLWGQGIGRLLLQEAESNITPDCSVEVRSTLSARRFYERNGYLFQREDISRAGFAIAILNKVIA